MTTTFLALLVGLHWLGELSNAGGSDPEPIYGGDVVEACGWPTAVFVGGCTGSLVHPELVVTAGHCVAGPMGPPSRITLADDFRQPVREVQISGCEAHPNFTGGPGSEGHDMAWCRLSEPITDLPPVPILMGCETDVLTDGRDVVLVGFGEADDQLGMGPKRQANTTIDHLEGAEAVVGLVDGDACHGDSGGPAYVRLDDGSWRVFGVTSRGYGPNCGLGTIYEIIPTQIEWFEESTGLDLTPCFDADGTWNPGPDCNGSAIDPGLGGADWANGCSNGTLSEPSESCGENPLAGGGESSGGSDTGMEESSSGGESSDGGTSLGPCDDSGDETSSSGGGETTDVVVSGSAGQRGDEEGCGCRSQTASPWWLGLWIAVIGIRRRSR